MDIPSNIIIKYFYPRNTYLDKYSREGSTERVKAKYKLLFQRIKELEVYVFFILTTRRDACVTRRTCEIYPDDWEERINGHLNADCSYVDVKKHIVMSTTQVLDKIEQGFEYSGKINQIRFIELGDYFKSHISSTVQQVDTSIKDYIEGLIDETPSVSEKFIKSFEI